MLHLNKFTNLYVFRDVNNITSEGAGFQFMFVTNVLLAVFFFAYQEIKVK